MEEAEAQRVLRTPSLIAAFAGAYDGPHDPRDALTWLVQPGEPGPSGRLSPATLAREARAALYRPDVSEADRAAFREQVERVQRDEAAARAALDQVLAARAVVTARRRVARRAAVGVAAALVLAATAIAALAQHPAAPTAEPTSSPAPTGLDLRRLPAGWELASLVRRGDGLTSGSSLTINRSVTGGEFLLVVRCPADDGRFRVVLTDTGQRFGGPWTGVCGAQAAVPLALERGVGRVQVVVTTRGDLPFSAAVVRRGRVGG